MPLWLPIGTTVRAAALAAALALSLSLAPAASATTAETPRCSVDEVTARPGLDRAYSVYCGYTDRVNLVRAPTAGRLSGLTFTEQQRMTWRFEPSPGAPANDRFEVELEGPVGVARQRIPIRTIPREVNTAPRCQPVRNTQRTDGTSPAELRSFVYCSDDESDEIRLEGSGPGRFLDLPTNLPGGVGRGGGAWARYRTAIAVGEEQAAYWGTDVLGARSEQAPIVFTIGPGVDRLPECASTSGPVGDPFHPIFSRPGAVRRFGLHCFDRDGDPIEPRVGTGPERGRAHPVRRRAGVDRRVLGHVAPRRGDLRPARVVHGRRPVHRRLPRPRRRRDALRHHEPRSAGQRRRRVRVAWGGDPAGPPDGPAPQLRGR